MNTLGNIIWFIFGGVLVAIEYAISSLMLCLTIIGIPFGIQTFKLARLALFPFGKKTVVNEKSDGCLSLAMNIIWILIGGIWIAATHLVFGMILFITVIGIPFAKQHFKLASVALLPSCPLALLPSCPLALLPSCPLALWAGNYFRITRY